MPATDGAGGPVRWDQLTWPETRAVLTARPNEVALLPVGATEQHGPHLPNGTDSIIAERLCEAVSSRTGAPVLPTMSLGCSYGHGTDLPGTLSLTPERLADVVGAVVRWAACSGLRRILAVNAHFGNQASLSVASDHLRHERPDLRFGVLSWWTLTPEVSAETLADGNDVHANRAETAMMLALAPELVRMDQMASADDEDRTDGLVFRYTAPVLSTNGVTGRPSEATAELGQHLLGMVLEVVCDAVARGRVEEPPLAHSLQQVAV